jgi:uncharacterized protein (TIGR03086 family)
MEPVEQLRTSMRTFGDRVRGVRSDQWSAPTPCAEWDVRTLVNHLVYEQRWSVPLFAGATIAEVGDQFEGDLLGGDPVNAYDDAMKVASDAATASGTVHLSFGDTPANEYVLQLLSDHLIHGWDLAVATGADRTLDPQIVATVSTWFDGVEEPYRAAGAIGPRVELPEGASTQDRLLARFGRDPRQ